MIQVIPSSSEDEMVVPIQVITCAQPIMEDVEQDPTKKRKQNFWRERQAKMATKKQKEEEKKQQQETRDTEATSSSKTSKNEGVLVLDTLLMAYKSQLKSRKPLKNNGKIIQTLSLRNIALIYASGW